MGAQPGRGTAARDRIVDGAKVGADWQPLTETLALDLCV